MKPGIGITPSLNSDNKYTLNADYARGVTDAGGVAVVLTFGDVFDALTVVDGLLFSGGGDIDSKYFGEQLHPLADVVDPRRDEFELSLCRAAFAARTPMLCVCRGIQVLNVALGGGLAQHIEGHSRDDARREAVHSVKIADGTLLKRITQRDALMVNSIHHQAVSRVAPGLIVSATTDDGVIEGVEAADGFVLGVQWHPEAIFATFKEQAAIFDMFVKAARGA
jgi:putative glutamine amidotransferase